jgi:competence protein ComEA
MTPQPKETDMLKRIGLAIVACFAFISLAFAQVDANKADASALDGVKGIGPTIAKRIVDERQAHGPYKDWADFENRVKGIGDKKAAALSQAGLTVNGQSASGQAPVAADKTSKAARAPAASASSSGSNAHSPEKADKRVEKPVDKAADKAADKRAGNTKASPAANPFNGAPAKQ